MIYALTGPSQEAFRNDALAGGYRWPSSAAALCYAMGKGREIVASGRSRLACQWSEPRRVAL